MNKYAFEGSFDKEIIKQANKIIMRGDVIRISEDESQVYSAEIKNPNGEPLNIMVSIEVDYIKRYVLSLVKLRPYWIITE